MAVAYYFSHQGDTNSNGQRGKCADLPELLHEIIVRILDIKGLVIDMSTFEDYLETIKDEEKRARMREVLEWVKKKFPKLIPRVAWNQPMFTDHGTFIIGFSMAKNHFAVSPEPAGIKRFAGEIEKSGYSCSPNLFRIQWTDTVDYSLLERIIRFTITDKAECTSFWRK